jgi:hypothetical protein
MSWNEDEIERRLLHHPVRRRAAGCAQDIHPLLRSREHERARCSADGLGEEEWNRAVEGHGRVQLILKHIQIVYRVEPRGAEVNAGKVDETPLRFLAMQAE